MPQCIRCKLLQRANSVSVTSTLGVNQAPRTPRVYRHKRHMLLQQFKLCQQTLVRVVNDTRLTASISRCSCACRSASLSTVTPASVTLPAPWLPGDPY